MSQDQQPRPWWKDSQLVWVLAALVLTWLLTTTILFLFPLPTILSMLPWQSWDWRWLVLLGLIFLSASVLYLTVRRVWNRLFDLMGLRGKTLWDLLGLLIVPVVIALAGWWLSEVSTRNQQQIETDRARQSVLRSYIQDMTELLLDKGLATSKSDGLIRQVARANTLSAIQRLDSSRNRILLGFLSDSNLLSGRSVSLLRSANLSGVNLSGADLRKANMFGVNLSSADLSDADLSDANLLGVNLRDADLSSADLSGANLRDADLSGADLSGANLSLISMRVNGAILFFIGDADLSGVNLSGADLSDAKGWTNEQLAQAESLVGAVLPEAIRPDETVMTEETWEEFKKQYRQ